MIDKLNNRQFVTLALIAIFCGIIILGHDYFKGKKTDVYDQMSILLLDDVNPNPDLEPGHNPDPDPIIPTPIRTTIRSYNPSPNPQPSPKPNPVIYNYTGRLVIKKIGLNKGFLKCGATGNNVDKNVAVVCGFEYPTIEASNLILAAHNGSTNVAYFKNIPKLQIGDTAIVQYDHKQYTYRMVQRYLDPKGDSRIKVNKNGVVKQLTLVTCNKDKKPGGGHTYNKNYLVLVFHLISEIDCNGQC